MDILAIPVVAMAGLYLAYNQDKKSKVEQFSGRTGQYENSSLPNIDVPNIYWFIIHNFFTD